MQTNLPRLLTEFYIPLITVVSGAQFALGEDIDLIFVPLCEELRKGHHLFPEGGLEGVVWRKRACGIYYYRLNNNSTHTNPNIRNGIVQLIRVQCRDCIGNKYVITWILYSMT